MNSLVPDGDYRRALEDLITQEDKQTERQRIALRYAFQTAATTDADWKEVASLAEVRDPVELQAPRMLMNLIKDEPLVRSFVQNLINLPKS